MKSRPRGGAIWTGRLWQCASLGSLMIVVLIACGGPRFAYAKEVNGCRPCSEEWRDCMSGYSRRICQIELDRCMKKCRRKHAIHARR